MAIIDCQDEPKLYDLPVYLNDRDAPFIPDGNHPLIRNNVEKVVGMSRPFKDLKCARKVIVAIVED
jgi:hypothetical protein